MRAFHQGLNSAGVSWEKDIKPVLGPEVDLAWLDFDHGGEDVVVLMQPRNEQKFSKLLEDQGAIFHAKVGGWQVLSPTREVLERFKTESGAGDSLADAAGFKQAMGNYGDETLFRAYVDGATLMRLARREAQKDPDFRRIFPKLGRLDWFATALRATDDGIRWDANVHGTPGEALKGITPTRTFTPALAHEVPKDAIAYWTFHGTKGMLQGLDRNPIFKDVPEIHRYRGVITQIGRLLEGENALYVRPAAAQGKIPEVTFVAEPAPGTDGAAVLNGLVTKYQKQMELPSAPKRTTVGGVHAYWVFADPVRLYWANVGKRLVVTDRPGAFAEVKGTPAPLTQSSEYNGALDDSGMPDKTQGFLYVNVRGGIAYAQKAANLPVPGSVKRNLRPLRSAVEYAATQPSEIQVTFFLRIK
jgi:hypothetical protein